MACASLSLVLPFSIVPDGVRLAVRLTPRSSRASRGGIVHDAEGRAFLQVRVTAPPVDGEANAALVAFIAKDLSVRKSDVMIETGHSSRFKMVRIKGEGPALAARLEGRLKS